MSRTLPMTLLLLIGMAIPAACAPAISSNPGAPGDPGDAVAPRIDDRAARAFFELAAALQTDQEPGNEQWRALLDSQAVAILESEGLPREALAEAYSLALKPSRADERDMLDRSTSLGRIVTHVQGAATRSQELLAFLDGLDARTLGIDVDRLRRFVPPAWRTTRPTIAVALFGPDLREGEVFVVDLVLARDTDLGPFLGHESFQWYRQRHRRVDPATAEPADLDLLWAFDRLQARGIANQVDKAPLIEGSLQVPESDRRQVEAFRHAISQGPDHLRVMDRLLAAAAADPGRRTEIGAEIRRMLPQGGHPTGFYMATVILESGAGDQLAATAGNCFAFVDLYQQAASSPGGAAPAFSPEAMSLIRSLAARYGADVTSEAPPAEHP